MKLTIVQMFIIRKLLTQTNEVSPDGKAVPKTFSGLDFSACRWFVKNTDEVMNKYQELLDKKKEKLNKEYEKERELEKGARSKLAEYVKNLDLSKDEGKKDKMVVELAQKLLGMESTANKINDELTNDKELQKAFKETQHEIEIKDKTMALLKKEFNNYEFSINSDIEISDVLDLFLDEKSEESEKPKKGE